MNSGRRRAKTGNSKRSGRPGIRAQAEVSSSGRAGRDGGDAASPDRPRRERKRPTASNPTKRPPMAPPACRCPITAISLSGVNSRSVPAAELIPALKTGTTYHYRGSRYQPVAGHHHRPRRAVRDHDRGAGGTIGERRHRDERDAESGDQPASASPPPTTSSTAPRPTTAPACPRRPEWTSAPGEVRWPSGRPPARALRPALHSITIASSRSTTNQTARPSAPSRRMRTFATQAGGAGSHAARDGRQWEMVSPPRQAGRGHQPDRPRTGSRHPGTAASGDGIAYTATDFARRT